MYLIYKLTSPSGKSYIGQTNNIRKRINSHKSSKNKCIAIKNAIQKYGWDNIQLTILAEDLSIIQANELETELINSHTTCRFPLRQNPLGQHTTNFPVCAYNPSSNIEIGDIVSG